MIILKYCPMCKKSLSLSKYPNTLMGLTCKRWVCWECYILNLDLWDYNQDCLIKDRLIQGMLF